MHRAFHREINRLNAALLEFYSIIYYERGKRENYFRAVSDETNCILVFA